VDYGEDLAGIEKSYDVKLRVWFLIFRKTPWNYTFKIPEARFTPQNILGVALVCEILYVHFFVKKHKNSSYFVVLFF
jgi:hypothetical protein